MNQIKFTCYNCRYSAQYLFDPSDTSFNPPDFIMCDNCHNYRCKNCTLSNKFSICKLCIKDHEIKNELESYIKKDDKLEKILTYLIDRISLLDQIKEGTLLSKD